MTTLTLNAGDLARALSKLTGIVSRKSTIPILANVLIKTQGEGALLTVTDLDMQATTRVALEEMALTPVETTICAHTLYDVVRKFPSTNIVTLDCSDPKEVIFKSGRSKFRFPALPTGDFPSITPHSYSHDVTINAAHLHKLFAHAVPFISGDELRYYLNGIYFHQVETNERNTLRGVATDGHRLARIDHDVSSDTITSHDGTALPSVIIPRTAISVMLKLLADDSKKATNVQLEVGNNSVRLTLGQTEFVTKLVHGTFPDYTRVIPSSGWTYEAKIPRELLACAVDRVSSVKSDKASAVKVEAEGNQITISMAGADSGSASETLDVEATFLDNKNNILEVGFNYRYLLDLLNVIEGETVIMRMIDASAPAIIQDADIDAAKNALFVLMPMRF